MSAGTFVAAGMSPESTAHVFLDVEQGTALHDRDITIDDLATMPTALRESPKTERGQETLDALMHAAIAVLEREGHGRLSTTMVAAEADLSIGTVYRFFPDRIALLEAIGLQNLHHLRGRLIEAAGSGPERLFEAVVAAYKDLPSLRSIGIWSYGPADASPELRVWRDVASALPRPRHAKSQRTQSELVALVRVMHASVAIAFHRDAHGEVELLREAHEIFVRAHAVQSSV